MITLDLPYTPLPSIENVDAKLLCDSLNSSYFIVQDGLPEVVVRDMAFTTLPNEIARLRDQLVDVSFQLSEWN